jgi:hypothetical protein
MERDTVGDWRRGRRRTVIPLSRVSSTTLFSSSSMAAGTLEEKAGTERSRAVARTAGSLGKCIKGV